MAGGPVSVNTAMISLGLAQVRIGASATNIAQINRCLGSAASIGSLANTKFISNVDFWNHESGFPLKEDLSVPIRESAALECNFEEITPYNLALARGLDPASYNKTPLSGEIALGALTTPSYVRMESIYTYPDGQDQMAMIFPRAQVASSTELDFQKEDNVKPPIMITSKRADSTISGGNAVWDDMPLGRVYWTPYSAEYAGA